MIMVVGWGGRCADGVVAAAEGRAVMLLALRRKVLLGLERDFGVPGTVRGRLLCAGVVSSVVIEEEADGSLGGEMAMVLDGPLGSAAAAPRVMLLPATTRIESEGERDTTVPPAAVMAGPPAVTTLSPMVIAEAPSDMVTIWLPILTIAAAETMSDERIPAPLLLPPPKTD